MMRKKNSQRGFTYIEMMMAVLIISIMALVAGPVLAVSVDLLNHHMDRYDLEESASVALNRMTREIRRLRDDQSMLFANATTLAFYDVDNTIIVYFAIGGSVARFQSPPASGFYSLLENVQPGTLNFTYYDDNGTVIPAPVTGANDTDIRRIEIAMTLQDASGSHSLPVRTTVRPRNLKHVSDLFA